MYTLLLSAALLADATLVQTMTVELNPNLPQRSGAATESMKMFAEPRDLVFELHGTRIRSSFGAFDTLYSLDTGKVQVIDHKGGRYATGDVGDFESLARAMRPESGAPALGNLSFLKSRLRHLGAVGTGKSAAGIECHVERYELTFVVEGQPPDDRLAQAMTAQRMEFDQCVAPAPAGFAEYQAAQARLSELIGSFADQGTNALGDLILEPMRKLQAETFSKSLMPVQSAIRLYLDVRKMLPEGAEVPAAVAALADRPLATVTVDTKSYTTGPVDAARFALPAGLQEVPLREMDLRKLIAAR